MPSREQNMMGGWGATAFVVNGIIGSGIFITPTSILNNVQSVGASLIVWLLAGIISVIGAFCYVELGTSIRKSGGDFAYLCHMRWTTVAFTFMSAANLFIVPCYLAIEMETFAKYLQRGLRAHFCEPFDQNFFSKMTSFSLLLLLFFLNCFSIRGVVARFQMLAMIAKIIASGIIIIVGLMVLITKGAQSNNFREPFANTSTYPGHWVLALFAGLFSYDGWDILNFGAEDVKKPHRSMPFAIIVGMSTVATLYLAMNLSYFVVLSVPEVQKSNAIAMTFAERTLGGFLQYAMPFLVCIVLIGSLNATLFQGSRYIWASARERHFPSFISCINRQHDSPRAALFVHVLLSMAFSFLGNLEELISYVAFTNWVSSSKPSLHAMI
uniref:AA_permease domain-containing protein n=1 Tax=Globodera pallida TaxID=36090 RepID=A0A183BQT7_GLOPA